ncbi:MAG: hypothetical protein HWQ42_25480 [Nostoc sp. JL23]|uniref:hypothetical protein n=2 Tax=Nostoc TaxID=1177 RepID=UPI001D8E4141|nr:hypothetical protein [Nostoc sp. JL23]
MMQPNFYSNSDAAMRKCREAIAPSLHPAAPIVEMQLMRSQNYLNLVRSQQTSFRRFLLTPGSSVTRRLS